ncbi:hypothetical protein QYE76_045313 [Lolium multiflorum]|uniref:H15 domain-containing protein n=1 Tax=Lolium multiflorum TaxID=4521 RepID=A0AAD8WXJ1_LOLMU|nr:hypothetical protein QYE76_045313 [Lolium multiflorum]
MGESSSSTPAAEAAAPNRREPTPDHPPYSWMIGEAIAELGEGGGSAEAAISGFIRARHPGVPAAHDRFLRHYLAKHVAEGLFVRAATGRYSLPLDDDDDDETVLELADAPPPPAEPKRGRGRPRRDGSAPTPTPTPKPAAGNEGRSQSPSAAPKRRGRPPKGRSQAPAAAAAPAVAVAATARSPATEGKRGPGRPRKDGSTPATGKKRGSKPPSGTTKRGRGRPRVLPQTADVSGEALATDMKDSVDGPATADNNDGQQRELALAAANDGSTAPSVTGEDDSGEAPSAKLPLLAKEPAAVRMPERSTQPCEVAPVAADEGSALALAADKEDGTQAPLEGSAPALVADKEDGTQAPSEGSAPALVADKEDIAQPPLEGSAPLLVANKEHGTQAPFEGSDPLLVADKEDGTQAPSDGPAPPLVADNEDGTQTPLKGSAPARVADKDDFTEPLFTKHKRGRRTCRSAPAKATHAPAWTSISEDMAGSKALSAPAKGSGRQCRPASVAAGELLPRRPVQIKPQKMLLLNADRPGPIKPRKMLLLNADPPVPIKPQKMLLLNADEVPDHPGFCVLALPAPVPTPTKGRSSETGHGSS